MSGGERDGDVIRGGGPGDVGGGVSRCGHTGANAGDVYVTNAGNHKVSVIDPTTNSVMTTITVGDSPQRVAVA